MRTRDDRRTWPGVMLALLLAAGCGDAGGGAAAGGTAGGEGAPSGEMGSTSSAMTAEAPAGTCTDAATADTVPCIGLPSGTAVTLKVQRGDSGSTSTVPYSALAADCGGSSSDSGSTSTVPCTVVVKKK